MIAGSSLPEDEDLRAHRMRDSGSFLPRAEDIKAQLEELMAEISVAFFRDIDNRPTGPPSEAAKRYMRAPIMQIETLMKMMGVDSKKEVSTMLRCIEEAWCSRCKRSRSPVGDLIPPRLFNYPLPTTSATSNTKQDANLGLPLSQEVYTTSGHAFSSAGEANDKVKIKTTGPSLGDPAFPLDSSTVEAPTSPETPPHPIYALGRAHMSTISRLLSVDDEEDRQGQLDWSDIISVSASSRLRA
jgi:hypothetical protein